MMWVIIILGVVFFIYHKVRSTTFTAEIKGIQFITKDYDTACFKISLISKKGKLATFDMKKDFLTSSSLPPFVIQVENYIKSIKKDTPYIIEFSHGYITIIGENEEKITDLREQKFDIDNFYKDINKN